MLVNSPSLQKEIVDRLVREFEPDAIYLFGSHAWGEPGHESDLDLLVIVSRSDQNSTQRAMRAQRSLRGLLMPIDVLVRTRAEIERYQAVYASLEAQIIEKGKLLYGREK